MCARVKTIPDVYMVWSVSVGLFSFDGRQPGRHPALSSLTSTTTTVIVPQHKLDAESCFHTTSWPTRASAGVSPQYPAWKIRRLQDMKP